MMFEKGTKVRVKDEKKIPEIALYQGHTGVVVEEQIIDRGVSQIMVSMDQPLPSGLLENALFYGEELAEIKNLRPFAVCYTKHSFMEDLALIMAASPLEAALAYAHANFSDSGSAWAWIEVDTSNDEICYLKHAYSDKQIFVTEKSEHL